MIINKEFYRIKTINTAMTEDPMQFNQQISLMLEALIVMQVFPDNVMAQNVIRQKVASKQQSKKGIVMRNESAGNSTLTLSRSSRHSGVNTMRDDLPKKRDKKEIMKQTTLKHTTMPKRKPATDITTEVVRALPEKEDSAIRIRGVKEKITGPSSAGSNLPVREVEGLLQYLMQSMGEWLELGDQMIPEFGTYKIGQSRYSNGTTNEEKQNRIRAILQPGLERIDNFLNHDEHKLLTVVDKTKNIFDLNLSVAEEFIIALKGIGSKWVNDLSDGTCFTEPSTTSLVPMGINQTTLYSSPVEFSTTNPTVKVPTDKNANAIISVHDISRHCSFLNSPTNKITKFLGSRLLPRDIIDIDSKFIEDFKANYCNLEILVCQFRGNFLSENGTLIAKTSVYPSCNNFGISGPCANSSFGIRGIGYQANNNMSGGTIALMIGGLVGIFGLFAGILYCRKKNIALFASKTSSLPNPKSPSLEHHGLRTQDPLLVTKVTSEPNDGN